MQKIKIWAFSIPFVAKYGFKLFVWWQNVKYELKRWFGKIDSLLIKWFTNLFALLTQWLLLGIGTFTENIFLVTISLIHGVLMVIILVRECKKL